MIEENNTAVIEGLLFVAGEDGLKSKDLSLILGKSIHEVDMLVREMCREWKQARRGIQIVKIADAYQITTLPEHSHYFSQLHHTSTRERLSRASLETLAIIAYKQPVTRLDIEEIRGVKSERIIQVLLRKGLIKDGGRSSALGCPILYETTIEFLQYFGLNDLNELPEPDSIFEWKEQEEEKNHLFQRLGMEI